MINERRGKLSILFLLLFLGISLQLTADTASKDRKYSGFTIKQLDNVDRYLEMSSLTSAERALGNAERYLGKISDGYKSEGEGAALVARYNDAAEQLAEALGADASESAMNDTITEEKRVYNRLVNNNSNTYMNIYALLAYGRDGETKNIDMQRMKEVYQSFPQFQAYEREFRETFSHLIDQNPDYSGGSGSSLPSVSQFLDAFKNGEAYLNTITEKTCLAYLNQVTESLENGLDDAEEGYITSWLLVRIYPDGPEGFEGYREIRDFYEEIGKDLPRDPVKRINTLISDITDTLKKESRKNKWKKSDYPFSSEGMRTCYENTPSRRINGELIEIGAIREKDWTVQRNRYGTILSETGAGAVLTRIDSLPFDLIVNVEFTKFYDGSSYKDVTDIYYNGAYYPAKR